MNSFHANDRVRRKSTGEQGTVAYSYGERYTDHEPVYGVILDSGPCVRLIEHSIEMVEDSE